jgi:hypothetical protein
MTNNTFNFKCWLLREKLACLEMRCLRWGVGDELSKISGRRRVFVVELFRRWIDIDSISLYQNFWGSSDHVLIVFYLPHRIWGKYWFSDGKNKMKKNMIWAIKMFLSVTRRCRSQKFVPHLQPPPYKLESWNFGSRSILGQLDVPHTFEIWHPKGTPNTISD